MTTACIHCGKNPLREDAAHLDKVTNEYYDISQITMDDKWLDEKSIKPNIKLGKISVMIEWYSDGSRKVVIAEKGWSNVFLEEIDRRGKGIRDEICRSLSDCANPHTK